MDKVALLEHGKTVGELTLQPQGLYTLFRVQAFHLDDTVQAVYLIGGTGAVRLGILEKIGQEGHLTRRLSNQTWRSIGQLTHGDLRPAHSSPWQPFPAPGFRSPYLQKTCQELELGLWRTHGAGCQIALPYQTQTPYALMALFCFAKYQELDSTPYLVVTLDDMEHPMV